MSLIFFSPTGLAVIGCSVSEKSIYAVLKEIASIRSKLNITAEPWVENLSPTEAKQYLERHSLQLCVLVVDAETIKDLPSRGDDYKVLLKTAVERVGKKIHRRCIIRSKKLNFYFFSRVES